MPQFKKDVQMLKSWGGNFVSVVWNSGYAGDPFYVKSLVSALEFARALGLRVELVLHSRGLKTLDNGDITNQQINVVDERLTSDWAALLGDSTTSARIAKSVDIYGILSEPVNNAAGGRASISDPILDQVCATIRAKTGNENAICAYSGPDYGGNATELIGTSQSKKNVAIEVHPYRWIDEKTHFAGYVNVLREAGYLVFVGEMGWEDPSDFVREQVKFFEENGLSFAFWGMIPASEGELLTRSGTVTPNGKVLQEALR